MSADGRQFQIVTLANDRAQYGEMRRSFMDAGFTEDRARFTLYDNGGGNRHDPYEILRRLPGDGSEPYVVFCHQDVRLDLGHGYERLAAQVEMLNARDPRWAVAGNAGGDQAGRVRMHLNEPTGQWREKILPLKARSLDENFLLLRRDQPPFGSPGLHGFHLYGTDVCLNAIVRGRSAYVIDFLLTHLSGGNYQTPAFDEASERLARHWGKYFLAGLVRTTCTELCLSCSGPVRTVLRGRRRLRNLFRSLLGNPLIRNPLCSP